MELKMNEIKIGVAGVGHMGRYHINLLSSILPIENIYIFDINQEACENFVKEYGVTYIKDYDEMLSLIDAVVIVVPTYLHYNFTTKALNAGCHVLVEKPIADNPYHAYEMLELAKNKNLILHVGHVERFNGAVHEIRKLITEPQYVTTQRIGSVSRIQDVGVVLDLMIHDIDLILSLVGSPVKEVQAYGKSLITDFEDYALATLYFENGCVAQLTASRVSTYKDRSMSIAQMDNYIHLDYASNEIRQFRKIMNQYEVSQGNIKYKEEHVVDRVFVIKGNPLETELRYFIDAIVDPDSLNTKYKDFIWDDHSNLYTMSIAFQILDQIKRNNPKNTKK